MSEQITVGIDVSKDRLDVHLRPTSEAFAVPRDGAGLTTPCDRLKARTPALVALEATGGYETVVAAALAGAGLPIVVVNPGQIRSFARALGKRAETDPIDAAVIAHFAEATAPELRPLPDEATQMLADLVARRRQIVEMTGSERQRLRRMTLPKVRRAIERLIHAPEKELADLDRDIDDAVRGSPAWREAEDLLSSVPGVGPIVSRSSRSCRNQATSTARRSLHWPGSPLSRDGIRCHVGEACVEHCFARQQERREFAGQKSAMEPWRPRTWKARQSDRTSSPPSRRPRGIVYDISSHVERFMITTSSLILIHVAGK